MPWIQKLLPDSEVDFTRQALLALAEEVTGLGTWAYRPATKVLAWSDNMFRIYGFEPGEVVPTPDFAIERVHPSDRRRVLHGLARAKSGAAVTGNRFRILRADGALRRVEAAAAQSQIGSEPVLIGSLRDVSDRYTAERVIATYCAVSDALTEWTDLSSGAERLLEHLATALECEYAVFWVPHDGQLVPTAFWQALDANEFEGLAGDVRLKRGEGLAGSAWQAGDLVGVHDVAEESGYGSLRSALGQGIRGAAAIPAVKDGEVLAVVALASRAELELGGDLERTLRGIVHELGWFLASRRGQLAPTLLTPRQQEVLQLAAAGHTGREIGSLLGLGDSTVKTHFDHIYFRLGVSDRAAAVATGLRLGLID